MLLLLPIRQRLYTQVVSPSASELAKASYYYHYHLLAVAAFG